ncbi:hypothetical protein H0H81_005594 [Sphagnurus paluster]|uniref:Uncharacterized protein n=1 Tax=Sphagnurus paluster TaxID=117069 RepID=A0A9P7FLD0_9AGAR|nr:hypothetical protein H0H81_005594 [Sphagnurus paluster]
MTLALAQRSLRDVSPLVFAEDVLRIGYRLPYQSCKYVHKARIMRQEDKHNLKSSFRAGRTSFEEAFMSAVKPVETPDEYSILRRFLLDGTVIKALLSTIPDLDDDPFMPANFIISFLAQSALNDYDFVDASADIFGQLLSLVKYEPALVPFNPAVLKTASSGSPFDLNAVPS